MPGLLDTIQDPQFQRDIKNNAGRFLGMPQSSGLGLPSEQDLAKMDWPSLVELRKKFSGTEHQNMIAPYEHRAYAREFTNTPLDALKMAVFSAGYTPYKAVSGVGRSQPAWNSIGQGLLGTLEGLSK